MEYWSEYLVKDKAVFLFHLEDGYRSYEVKDFVNNEVLALCEKYVLKIQPRSHETDNEYTITKWIGKQIRIPKIIGFFECFHRQNMRRIVK